MDVLEVIGLLGEQIAERQDVLVIVVEFVEQKVQFEPVRAVEDQKVAVEDGVDLVFQLGAPADKHVAEVDSAAPVARLGVGPPDLGQIVAAQQVGQNAGIDLVGFHLGVGDGSGLQGIADHHAAGVAFEQIDQGPGEAGGLEGDGVGGPQ